MRLILSVWIWFGFIRLIESYSFLDSCAIYNGTILVTNDAGLISDGPGPYSTSLCTWHIQGTAPFTLQVLLLEIAGNPDETLKLYDTSMDDAHLLYDFGAVLEMEALQGQLIQTNTSDIWIEFIPSPFAQYEGFVFAYYTNDSNSPLNETCYWQENCSDNGDCVQGNCQCYGNYTGTMCHNGDPVFVQSLLDLQSTSSSLRTKLGWDGTPISWRNWFGLSITASNRLYTVQLTKLNLTAIPGNGVPFPPYMNVLDLSQNQIQGTLPLDAWGGSLYLNDLRLFRNQFTGPISESIGQFPYLNVLNLEQNQFSGPLPDSISGLNTLSVVRLKNNQLTGPLHDDWFKWMGRNSVDLRNNTFFCPLPLYQSYAAFVSPCLAMTIVNVEPAMGLAERSWTVLMTIQGLDLRVSDYGCFIANNFIPGQIIGTNQIQCLMPLVPYVPFDTLQLSYNGIIIGTNSYLLYYSPLCGVNTFLSSDALQCLACPLRYSCSGNNSLPQALPGFYDTSVGFSFLAVPCPGGEEACLGGNQCGESYQGQYCAACVNGYASVAGQCVDCSNTFAVLLLVLVILGWILVLTAIVLLNVYCVMKASWSNASRSFIEWLQLASVLMSLRTPNLPTFFSYFSVLIADWSLLKLACISFSSDHVTEWFVNILFLPLMSILIVFLLAKWKYSEKCKDCIENLLSFLLIPLFYQVLSHFGCVSLDNGDAYWHYQPSISCNDSYYLNVMRPIAITAFVLYLFVYLLKEISYLIRAPKEKEFHWTKFNSFIRLIRNVLFVAAASIMTSNLQVSLFLQLILLVLSLIITLTLQPSGFHRFQSCYLLVNLIIIILVLLFYCLPDAAEANALKLIVDVILALCFVSAIVVTLYAFIRQENEVKEHFKLSKTLPIE